MDLTKLKRFCPNEGFQEDFFKALAKIRLITAGNQSGKALLNDSPVLTPDGWKPIGGLNPGDTVYDEAGLETKVRGVYPQGQQNIYRTHFSDNTFVDCTEDHLWKLSPRIWDTKTPSVITTKEIIERYNKSDSRKRKLSIPLCSPIGFKKRETPIDPYVMGALLGDGSMHQNSVRISSVDHEILDRVKSSIGSHSLKKLNHGRCDYIITYNGRHKDSLGRYKKTTGMVSHLREFELMDKNSYDKFVPKIYLFNDINTRLAVLQGLMDTDGSVYSHGTIEFSSVSKRLKEDVEFLVRSLGGTTKTKERITTYSYKGEKKEGRLSYRVYIWFPNDEIFYLKRKKNRLRTKRTTPKIIEKIEKIGTDLATCIMVGSELGTFITKDFVVTHNTHVGAVEAAMYALGTHPHKKIRTPNVGVIITAQSMKEGMEKTIMPKLEAVVGSNDIVRIKNNNQGHPTTIYWRTGSVTHLMTAEQKDKEFEGTTVGWCWMDEPMRRNIFIAVKRGMLTTGGHLWMTCTPLDEPWIYEELYIPGKEGTNPDIMCFEGSSDENVRISEAERKEFKALLTKDEIDARWYGKFRHLAGRVFKHFDPDRHIVPSFDVPDHWPVWVSIDPHTGKPHAVLFIAMAPTGVAYACNEIFVDCTPKALAAFILDVESQYNVVNRLIDSSSEDPGWEKISIRTQLRNAGVATKLAQKKNLKKPGIILLNQKFKEDELFVMEHCKRFQRELKLQVYVKYKPDRTIKLEEPEKKFDDMTDNARYIFNEDPSYAGMPKVKETGPFYQRVYD